MAENPLLSAQHLVKRFASPTSSARNGIAAVDGVVLEDSSVGVEDIHKTVLAHVERIQTYLRTEAHSIGVSRVIR